MSVQGDLYETVPMAAAMAAVAVVTAVAAVAKAVASMLLFL